MLSGEPIIAYCRIGERSAHTWFVLHELLGEQDVKNYDGSWTEWGNLVGVPIERSDRHRETRRLEAVQQVGQDPSGSPPNQVIADDIGVGPHRDAAPDQAAPPIARDQRGDRYLQHLSDLAGARDPVAGGPIRPTNGYTA